MLDLSAPLTSSCRLEATPREESGAQFLTDYRSHLPDKNVAYLVKRRRAGLGSLGRQRLVVLADWRGGMVAREIKSALPSAAVFAWHPASTDAPYYWKIVSGAIRVPDPFVRLHGNWIVRRLAPDCSRIELASLPQKRDETRLLYAMGFETVVLRQNLVLD